VFEMVDGSSSQLLGELNEKRRKLRLLPLAAIVSGLIVLWLIAASVAGWIILTSLIAVGAICWLAAAKDALRKTTVILFDLEADVSKVYERLHEAFQDLKACGRVWHVEAKAGVRDTKYHAGAGSLIKRRAVSVTFGQPPLVKTNVDVPLLPAGRQVLAFMPDRLLVFERSGVGAVPYPDLIVERSETRFIDEETVPSDATVVDKTWRYVNKKGGPDKRFKDNRELPVCAYSQLRFSSGSGLNEVFQMSRRWGGEPQIAALAAMVRLSSGQPDQPSNPAMEPTART
jgi:hypothetical protein